MTVADVMTSEVCSVPETAGFRAIVELIEKHHISALPVVDAEEQVVGVVSEADLLLKEDQAELAEPQRFESRKHREERAKAAGATARELMTAPAVTIAPQAPLRTAARRMHQRGVKRLPVVDRDGRLVGIVSRGDVLKVFVRDDQLIRREIEEYVVQGLMMLDPGSVAVEVADGMVSLRGAVDRMTDARILPKLCRTVDGVVSVKSRIEYRYDDERSRERPGVVSTP